MKLAIFLSITTLLGNISFFNFEKTINTSNVIDDLKSTANFNFDDYKKNTTGSIVNPPSIISFIENGYSFSKKVNSTNYGLYAIIYNPDLISFDFNSTLNKIELSAGNQDNFFKFHLDYLNDAYDSLYIKFKVSLSSGDKEKINESLNRDERIYRISGIELKKKESTNASDYFTQKNKMGGIYKYSGFSENIGESGLNKSDLSYKVEDLYTLNLEVKDTYYRFNTENRKEQTELDSVYFDIPDTILSKYGNLTAIDAEYFEYKTAPIFVIRSDDYSLFKDWVGINQLSSHCAYALIESHQLTSGDSTGSVYYSYTNPTTPFGLFGSTDISYLNNSSHHTSLLSYLFDGGVDGFNDISKNNLKSYIYSYKKSYVNGHTDDGLSLDLLNGQLDSGHTKGYNRIQIKASDSIDLKVFNGNSDWDYFVNIFNKQTEVKSIEPIIKVDSIVDKKASDFYINDNDFTSFSSDFNNAKINNKSTYLFRFSSGSYFRNSVSTYKYGDLNYEGTDGYVAQENVFLNFDIITLTFSKNGTSYIVPIVSNPIDIVGDIIHPNEGSLWASILKVLKIILLVVSIILGIWLVDKIFNILGINIVELISKPFKHLSKNKKKK